MEAQREPKRSGKGRQKKAAAATQNGGEMLRQEAQPVQLPEKPTQQKACCGRRKAVANANEGPKEDIVKPAKLSKVAASSTAKALGAERNVAQEATKKMEVEKAAKTPAERANAEESEEALQSLPPKPAGALEAKPKKAKKEVADKLSTTEKENAVVSNEGGIEVKERVAQNAGKKGFKKTQKHAVEKRGTPDIVQETHGGEENKAEEKKEAPKKKPKPKTAAEPDSDGSVGKFVSKENDIFVKWDDITILEHRLNEQMQSYEFNVKWGKDCTAWLSADKVSAGNARAGFEYFMRKRHLD